MTGQKLVLVAVGAGVALGAGTRLADNTENTLTWLGSLVAPWAVTAFGLGALATTWRRAVMVATSSMVIGVGIYYLWMSMFDGGANLSYFLSHTAFWLLMAPLAGVVFGISGWVWRWAGVPRLIRIGVVALTGGVIAGESTFMALSTAHVSSGTVTLLSIWITVGLTMPLVLLRERRDRITGLGLTLVCLLLGLAMIPVLRWIIAGGAPAPV